MQKRKPGVEGAMQGGLQPAWEERSAEPPVVPKQLRLDGAPPRRKHRDKGLRLGEAHPYWPEWTWDGAAFIKTPGR